MIRGEFFKQLTKFTYFLDTKRKWDGMIRQGVLKQLIDFTYFITLEKMG